MEQLEFRSFLLQISKDLTPSHFEQLKFVLKGFVSSGTCEEMKEVCHYFEELERRRYLTPTNLVILKKALNAIGRFDLVELLAEKEKYFAELFSPQTKDGDNLGQSECDLVCDGITKAAGNLQASSRSGQNTPDLQKQLKLTSNENEDEVQIPQFTDVLSDGDLLVTAVPTYGKQNGDPSMLPSCPTVAGLASHEAEMDLNCGKDAMTAKGSTPGDMAGKSELITCDIGGKEPSEHTVADGDNAERIPLKPKLIPGATSSSAADDVVTDGNEDKEGESLKAPEDEKMLSKEAEHQGPQDYGGARPKTTQGKPPGSLGTTKPTAKEQTDEVAETVPHGTMFEEKKSAGCGTFVSESTKEPAEGECTSTASPAGEISPDYESDPGDHSLDIIPDDGSEPGDHSLDDSYFEDMDDTEPSEKKTKSTSPCSWQGAGASNLDQHPPGASSSKKQYKGFTDQGASAHASHGFGHGASPFGSAAPQQSMPIAAQMEMLQQFLALQQLYANPCSGGGPGIAGPFGSAIPSGHPSMYSSSDAPRADSPAQLRSYDKGGYSVAISNGSLCQSSEEKGVVMMESGTQFKIALANNNDCAAEVDITFGGMFLGVWLVEAKRSLSNPLIIEGSSWAKGRLTFFSTTDPRRLHYNESCFGQQPEFNGVIDLEFKPEVLMLKLVVKHVWKDPQRRIEIFMPDFKTATVGDLKLEISKKYSPGVSCLIMSGKVLEEDKSMSSYALENTDEVIEVLHIKENLSIESSGRDPLTMEVDPFKVSIEEIKRFIEEKINISMNDQHLILNGQNIDEIDQLCDIFITAKETPVIRVDKDRNIKIKVHSHSGGQQEVQINWFATVNDLKEKLEQQGISKSIDTLKFNDAEISEEGRKQLIDLGFKPANAVITVRSQQHSTHRGFSASAFEGGSRTRGFSSGTTRGGFGDFGLSSMADYRGHPSGFSTLRSGPGDMQSDSAGSGGLGQEGIAMLYGNEESVYKQFQEDKQKWKFSKERAITLKIQLIAKSDGATAPPSSSTSSGGHYPNKASGPMSTPYPPPVPE